MYTQAISQIAIKRPITEDMFGMKLSQIFPEYSSGEIIFFPNQKMSDEEECMDYQKKRRLQTTRNDRRNQYKKNEKVFLDMVK